MRKKIPEPVTKGCPSCGSGDAALCLGCRMPFFPCKKHWSLFTYCSNKCAAPHRERLKKVLSEKLNGIGPNY